jgi:hypothetical protein
MPALLGAGEIISEGFVEELQVAGHHLIFSRIARFINST